MALVGSISGSAGTNSVIGVTGSVIFSNNPAASFPTSLPGADVQFFVSGSRGGKNGTTRNVAVFGGDAVVSGSLTVGTGSVVITSNDIQIGSTGHVQFDTAANRISVVGGELKFFDSANTGGFTLSALGSGGGGGGGSFFTENGNGVIYNSGSVAFTGARTGEAIYSAAEKGVDVQFYFSGSSAAGDSAKVALFGGPIVSSGSISVKSGGANPAITLSTGGVISGSGDFQAGGNLAVAGNLDIGNSTDTTISRVSPGRIAVESVNVVTISSSDTLTNKSINLTDNILTATSAQLATAVSDETGSGSLVFANTPTLTTPTIAQINNGSGDITLDASGDIILDADDADIILKDGGATFGSFSNNGGQLQIKNSAGTAAITLTSLGNVVIPGDLTVQGSTLTVNATTVEIQDPVIGLGFASGSNESTLAVGDRGFIGGLTGVDNAAFFWDHSESGFAATRTAAGTADGVPIVITDYSTLRAGKLEVGGGTNAWMSSSDGSTLLLNGATNKGVSLLVAGTEFANLKNNSLDSGAQFGATGGKSLWLSGSNINLNTGGGFDFLKDSIRVSRVTANAGASFTISAEGGAGNLPRALILTGSSIDFGANSQGFQFKFADQLRSSMSYGANTVTLGTEPGVALALSGANGIQATHGPNGLQLKNHSIDAGFYLTVTADGPGDAQLSALQDIILKPAGNELILKNSLNNAYLTLQNSSGDAKVFSRDNQLLTVGASGTGALFLTGSGVRINHGIDRLLLQSNGVQYLGINYDGTSTTTITGSLNQNLTIASGLGTTTLTLSGSTTEINTGGTTFKRNNTALVQFGRTADGIDGLFPSTDSGASLGSPQRRWANVYTGDLHLRNDRGNWTIIEEEDYLSITNNLSGKRFKFVLEEL